MLLLGEHAQPTSTLLAAVTCDLAANGRAVHHADADRLRRADLTHADRRIVVAIDRADTLSRPALLALDAHLHDAAATQLLLAGLSGFRELTTAPDLTTLHFAPYVIAVPRLPDHDAAAYLVARSNRRRGAARLLRAAAGDPLDIDRLAGARALPSLAILAETRPLASLLDRPLGLFVPGLALAIAAAGLLAPAILRHPPPPRIAAAPVALPPIQRLAPAPPVAAAPPPIGTVETTDAPPQSDFGITVDHEDPDDLLSPHIVHARAGETLAAAYARIYRGLSPPPFADVRKLNPRHPAPGTALVFPAPPDGWPAH